MLVHDGDSLGAAGMDNVLVTWAFALQGKLREVVSQQWPSEVGTWPLLRSFAAEGYRWRGTHLVVVLRNEHSQFPTMGEVRDLPPEWQLPDDAPNVTNIDQFLDEVQRHCRTAEQDAVVIVSIVGEGKDASKDFKLWSENDKALWQHGLHKVLATHLAMNVRNHAAQQQRVAAITQEQRKLERGAKLKALSGEFNALTTTTSITPQQRGKRFETWLGQLFDVYGLDRTLNVINPGEQIDFTFWKGDLFVVGGLRQRLTRLRYETSSKNCANVPHSRSAF